LEWRIGDRCPSIVEHQVNRAIIARFVGTAFVGAASVLMVLAPSRGAEFMFRARVDGQMVEGKPLVWDARQMLLLGRDGRLYDFNPTSAKEAEKTSPRFFGYTSSEMKAALQKEFGKTFDVSTTQHYLVVHPAGERDQWANRFEELYKRFTHYFRVRGFTPQEPPYPLMAVVFRDESEYFRHAGKGGRQLRPGTLGHYDPKSNRVFLFDTSGETWGDWSLTADTIIHEATHQTAYNVGVHQRFTDTPRWIVEGLATMFEARGFWDAHSDQTQSDRINAMRLRDFQDYAAKRRKPGALGQLLASDQAFQTDAIAAYAEAWALSFYVFETQPRLYAAYLQKTAARAPFSDYSPAERISDFQETFGREMKMFETKFLRYMADVK
jgi:hypothetical protein